MMRNRVLAATVAVLLGAHGGCSPNAKNSGETHWLGDCETDADCGGGGRCLCGVCTRTCAGDADCEGPRPAQCFATSSPGVAKRCGGDPPGAGICLGVCSGDEDCPKGDTCFRGACVADPADGGAAEAGAGDGGAADAAASSGEIAGKYVHVDAGVVLGDPIVAPELRTLIDGADESFVGHWAEYGSDGTRCTAENHVGYQYAVCMQLEITQDSSRGGLAGEVYWLMSDAVPPSAVTGPFAPASDPERGYPVEVAPADYSYLLSYTRARYRVFEGHVVGKKLTFWTSWMDLWTDWCALQTPYPYQGGGESGYRCVPQTASTQNTDLGRLALCSECFNPRLCGDRPCARDYDDGGITPVCRNFAAHCACTAKACTANLRAILDQYSFEVSGTTMRQVTSFVGIELRKVSP